MGQSETIGVLFSSAGRRVELLQLFRADAFALGVRARIVAVDHQPATSAACQAAERSAAVPRIDDPTYPDAVLKICEEEKIRLVIPLHDGELETYARHRERFAESGVRIVVSGLEAVQVARDKEITARRLAAAGVPVPRTALTSDVLADPAGWSWPLIAKPRAGSASIGLHQVEDLPALTAISHERPDYVIQERLLGREYTVNMFVDQLGRLRCAVPHQRLEVRGGEVSKGRTERHEGLCSIANRIVRALPGLAGPICFQAFVLTDGTVAVFEINARFGGGFPLAHRAGAAVPQWLIEESLGRECTASDEWRSGLTMLRYDAALYSQTAPTA